MTKTYYTIFNFIAIAAIIFLAVDSFYNVVLLKVGSNIAGDIHIAASGTKKQEHRKPPLSSYEIIGSRNIFSKAGAVPELDDISEIDNLEETTLNIALLGTIFGDQESSAAVIEDKIKRSQDLYRVGDMIQNAVLRKILRGKVILRVGVEDEILSMEESSGSSSPGSASASNITRSSAAPSQTQLPALERTITLSREEIDRSLADLNGLMSQASISAHLTNGQPDGLAVRSVKAGSIFRRMGLRNGDIIQGVQGNDIKSPDDLISLYNDLQSANEVTLKLQRRGQERLYRYRFR